MITASTERFPYVPGGRFCSVCESAGGGLWKGGEGVGGEGGGCGGGGEGLGGGGKRGGGGGRKVEGLNTRANHENEEIE